MENFQVYSIKQYRTKTKTLTIKTTTTNTKKHLRTGVEVVEGMLGVVGLNTWPTPPVAEAELAPPLLGAAAAAADSTSRPEDADPCLKKIIISFNGF